MGRCTEIEISGARTIAIFVKPTAYFAALLGLVAMAWGMFGGPESVAPSEKTAAQMPAERPLRVVSLNLCTDQLLMQLADHDQIAALSHLARDETMSAMAADAREFPVTRGTAEEVIALDPDLIVAGAFSTRETVLVLKKLGYRVVDFDPAADFSAIKGNIAKMALALGDERRGLRAIAQIDQALDEALKSGARMSENRPLFANLEANGYISGEGALMSAMAKSAGFDILGEQLGIVGTRQISLEQLLVSRPDMLGLSYGSPAPALALEVFSHPALAAVKADADSVSIPVKYTSCGTLSALDGLRLLRDARQGMVW